MATYRYIALTQLGEQIKGTYSAENSEEVISMLRENSYYPVEVDLVDESKNIDFSFFKKVKTKDISIFCRQFYTMLNAGITLMECLDILKVQTENKNLRKTIASVYEELQKGSTFYEALKKYNNIFPDLFINMVKAGEASGNLDVIMERMSVHYEKENKVKNQVQSAMVYPILISIVSIIVVLLLLTFVMPMFVGMFEGSGAQLPLPTRILLSISNALKKFWYIFLGLLALIVYATKVYFSTSSGRLILDRFKLSIPIIKNSTRKVLTSRFTRTLSTLLSSGVPLMEALDIVSNVVGNIIVSNGLKSAKDDLRQGHDLSTPIKKIGVFSPMVISMIRIGEESGTLDEILDKTADFFDEEVETSLKKLTTLLEPLMIIIMAIVIGAIVIAMILPMFDMFTLYDNL